MASSDDGNWGREAREGKEEETAAFARVLNCHHDRLAVLVRRLLGWPSGGTDVDDVLQDAYLAAWTKRHTFRGEGPEAAWLHRIAVNHARNHARASRRRQRLLSLFGRSTENRFGQPEDPGLSAVAETATDSVRSAMARLGHRDREVLVLRYLEDRGIDDLAAVLQISRAATDARLSRARNRLRSLLDATGNETALFDKKVAP